MRATNAPVVTLDGAARLVNEWHRGRRRVVFTNGVFDLLHPGHLRFLRAARAAGDVLLVAVNSDRSVRAVKGAARPILPEAERTELLAGLTAVGAVLVFDDETPAKVIDALQPDVLVKGADWPPDAIVGRETVQARGGIVVRVPVEEGYSTTGLIARIRSGSARLGPSTS